MEAQDEVKETFQNEIDRFTQESLGRINAYMEGLEQSVKQRGYDRLMEFFDQEKARIEAERNNLPEGKV